MYTYKYLITEIILASALTIIVVVLVLVVVPAKVPSSSY